ncbi:MAG: EAL domain-containing protein [Betaproteobacteria bacterium]
MTTVRQRLRKHLSPLAADTVTTLNLPPVRTGLLTKLNLLTVGLIALTAVTITSFYFWQQWRDDQQQLRTQGRIVLSMLSELAAPGLSTPDKAQIERMVGGIASGGDIAYLAVLDAASNVVAERRFSAKVADTALPPMPEGVNALAHGAATSVERRFGDQRYVELLTPVFARDGEPPVGYVRLGLSSERQSQSFRGQLLGALTVVGLLVILAVVTTLLLTRRLVAPMRRLMRAARAVGSGRLDVYVPAKSSDELGLLTHTFNHMTQRLAESQAQVGNYQKTLEEKVTQRTKELEVATAHAYKLAQHDILTGLPNRSLLNQRLKQILAQALRDNLQVACLFLDFDHFKRINDTLGHDAGDQLLQSIAQRLTRAVRESDTVARLGGDEFVIVLPQLDAEDGTVEVMAVISRIRESFKEPFHLSDQIPTLTCSIGVALYPADAPDAVELIKQADTAMYAAKESGRNAFRFFTADMNARVQKRMQMETDMRRAMENDEFFLVYQPQIDLQTGRPRGVEALLRWRDPERGLIAPAEFIPIAEESGMILVLGERVLREACRQVVAWHRQNMLLRLSVNLSVNQLQQENWVEIVQDALVSSGLSPHFLDLEITESVIITHADKAIAALVSLKAMGVSITVDDFGTGYSSLSYLARLPIQGLKVDQKFVGGLEINKNDEAITQAIIALSHSLGLRCTAEGVETDAQYNFLRAHGCEEAQGFLITQPLPEKEFAEWWEAHAGEFATAHRQPDLWQTTRVG